MAVLAVGAFDFIAPEVILIDESRIVTGVVTIAPIMPAARLPATKPSYGTSSSSGRIRIVMGSDGVNNRGAWPSATKLAEAVFGISPRSLPNRSALHCRGREP
jgi:hypothetical protein